MSIIKYDNTELEKYEVYNEMFIDLLFDIMLKYNVKLLQSEFYVRDEKELLYIYKFILNLCLSFNKELDITRYKDIIEGIEANSLVSIPDKKHSVIYNILNINSMLDYISNKTKYFRYRIKSIL